MSDLNVRPIPEEDGFTHINTQMKAKTKLGRLLALSYNVGEPIHHPLLGHFRTVQNLFCYLNTGGTKDAIRNMEPHQAINFMRLSPKYSCDKFRELILDATILKLQTNSHYAQMMAESDLPFDHYYLQGADRLPIRPSHSSLYIGILNDARKILRGEKSHEFVNFKDMNFTLIQDK
jgi:hypothetical protein